LKLRKKKINKDIEKQIITALIVSSSFIKKIQKAYKPEYLEIDYARTVAQWSFDYFNEYDKAPDIHIQDIFEVERSSIKESEAETIEHFLSNLSEEYERKDKLNIDYLADEARKYFKKRSLEILFDKGSTYASAGKTSEAEKLLLDHRQVSQLTSGRFNPFDIDRIRQFNLDNTENRLFKFPGALGELLGWFERSWLLAVMAPEKRGKSYLLEEIVFHALANRLKVFWVSLEMSKYQLEVRIYQRLTALAKKKGWVDYPVFDCANNQDDSCSRKKRTSDIGLFDSDGEMPEYKKGMDYKPCTECRNQRMYIPAYWYESAKVGKMTIKQIEKKARNFTRMFSSNLEVKSFPRFAASLDDIRIELDDLEYSQDFRPDVLVVDYLDILAPEKGIFAKTERDRINVTWQNAAGLAGIKNCLVVTADLSTKASRSKRNLDEEDTSENKLKDAHLDQRIALNQTPKEKADKVARISCLAHRHRYFDKFKEVMILQELSLSQPLLDSEWWSKDYEK